MGLLANDNDIMKRCLEMAVPVFAGSLHNSHWKMVLNAFSLQIVYIAAFAAFVIKPLVLID